jgi:hypothetical protein
VYGFLDPSHVFILIHIVLDVGLSSSCLPGVQAFGSKVARTIAVVAFSNLLLGAALERSLYLGDVFSEALLVCSVRGKAPSGEVHQD